eukprot:TRINITY_DN12315_c0_g1_i1.p1 TRINITY_DN12315_c0_g1~~TRINITY_DN12315_c0_g1_i1.p1  ORF type:complete len:403 (+),score=79.40 TRINITY_DN12315_c0_g1_i1:211-1419(+)
MSVIDRLRKSPRHANALPTAASDQATGDGIAIEEPVVSDGSLAKPEEVTAAAESSAASGLQLEVVEEGMQAFETRAGVAAEGADETGHAAGSNGSASPARSLSLTQSLEGSAASVDGDRSVDDQPLVIQADAALVDGLRALLVHHLKRSVGANVVNLSTSQAELLEHHLARLSSYAQKIVHTLAFATRFLSKQQFEDRNEMDGQLQGGGAGGGGCGGGHIGPPGSEALAAVAVAAAAAGVPGLPVAQTASNGGVTFQDSGSEAATPAPKPPKKSLKLNDDEILTLYRSAQVEAAIEADWRGITGPVAPGRGADAADRGYTGRTDGSGAAASHSGRNNHEASQTRAEYLRILSRAMQEPRGVEMVAAQKKSVCCGRDGGPGAAVPAVLDNVMGQKPTWSVRRH